MIDAYDLATLPIAYLLDETDPYDRFRNGSQELGTSYRDIVNNGIWGYQLHNYFTLVGSYFGTEVQQLVRQYHLTVFDPNEAGINALAGIFALIDGALATDEVTISTANGTVGIPVEMNIALNLLLNSPLSPDYVADAGQRDMKIANMGVDIDWSLAGYLARCREDVIKTFSPLLANYCMGYEREYIS